MIRVSALSVGTCFRRSLRAEDTIWRVIGFNKNDFFRVRVENVVTKEKDAFPSGAMVLIVNELEVTEHILQRLSNEG